MKVFATRTIVGLTLAALLLAACGATPEPPAPAPAVPAAPPTAAAPAPAALTPTVQFTLLTGGGTNQLVFVGVGDAIDKQINPDLQVQPGDVVEITLVNGDGVMHDLAIDEFQVASGSVDQQGQIKKVIFTAAQEGEFVYYCSVPGHRQAGMFGKLIVGQPTPVTAGGVSVVHNPADLPKPIGSRGPTNVRVDLTAKEVEGQLADGTTFSYFTFNGTIPAPMIRIRLGDTVELHLKNETSSAFQHSIDLHAVTGPGGGAVFTSTNPGQETFFTFKALNVGLYVYHCATPSVAHHIANGMYGLILVEPPGGLPAVDREFYVMQGEVYSEQLFGTKGHLDFSEAKLLAETPEYFVFNGAAGALTQDANMLHASVGESVRIFFGVGGPNFTSSFHVIGEIFDRAYPFAALSSPPLKDVQTVSVPPGGATMVEFELQVPGRYILVDHALSRLERGLAGFLVVDGPEDPTVFQGTMTSGSGH
jgi:nitrite reductase (NO-forming)